jgi:outer membrane biogenesis lipoprotein LolB
MLKLTSLTLALLLAGCVSYNHPEPKEAKQTLRQVQQGKVRTSQGYGLY